MTENPKAHHRLMHQFRQRIKWASGVSVFVGAGVLFFDWTGFGGRGGLREPQPFREIWWHFFVTAGILFAFFMLCPSPEEIEDKTD